MDFAMERVIAIKAVDKLIDAAMGRSIADLVLKNASVFNVFTGGFSTGDVAVVNGCIAGIGEYSGREEIDLTGKYVTPGFIDGHVHIESGMVSPGQFAAAIVAHGTTAIVADPHEIANVSGTEGIRYMLRATEELPLTVYMMLPSCVPATALENAGAKLTAKDLAEFINHPRVLGLGELMNYPGVLNKEPEVLEKVLLAGNKRIDGHAPGLTGKELTAYIAAGIASDHECVTPHEALERLGQGMHVMLRQGSAVKNLLDLLPAVNGYTVGRCLLATDDRHPEDLISQGHINYMVRLAVEAGVELAWVLQMATINAANYLGLRDVGAIAPGFRADMLVFDNLTQWQPLMVFKEGKLVAEQGKALFTPAEAADQGVRNTLKLTAVSKEKLAIPSTSSIARVIGLVPHQLVTTALELPLTVADGQFLAQPEDDILKLSVWERHRGTGNVGVGLLKGLGLKSGAIASSIAHDSHNVVAVGAKDEDIIVAVQKLQDIQGGIVIADKGQVLGALSLPLGGLMTDQDVAYVEKELARLQAIARRLGVKTEYDPFMTLAFLSLPVIPTLKLTDIGLVDVTHFTPVSVSR